MWIPFLKEINVPVVCEKQLLMLRYCFVYKSMSDVFLFVVQYTDLFKISTNSVTGPLLPLVALAICWVAFAILSARLKHRRTLQDNIDNRLVLEIRRSLTYPWFSFLSANDNETENKEKCGSNERGKELTFLHLWYHLDHQPKRGESMHTQLDIDQAS